MHLNSIWTTMVNHLACRQRWYKTEQQKPEIRPGLLSLRVRCSAISLGDCIFQLHAKKESTDTDDKWILVSRRSLQSRMIANVYGGRQKYVFS